MPVPVGETITGFYCTLVGLECEDEDNMLRANLCDSSAAASTRWESLQKSLTKRFDYDGGQQVGLARKPVVVGTRLRKKSILLSRKFM